MSDFIEWLEEEMNNQNLNRNQLAIRSRVDSGYISRILNRERKPGTSTLKKFAKALDIDEELIFRKAGMFSSNNKPRRIQDDKIAYRTSKLTDSQADEVINYIDLIRKRDERQKSTEVAELHTKQTREVKAPPERLKKTKSNEYLTK